MCAAVHGVDERGGLGVGGVACQQNQKQERLIWRDKSTVLQIAAGYETAFD